MLALICKLNYWMDTWEHIYKHFIFVHNFYVIIKVLSPFMQLPSFYKFSFMYFLFLIAVM